MEYTQAYIEKLLADAKSTKHLSNDQLADAIDEIRKQGKQAEVLIKLKPDAFKEYLAKHPEADPYEETLYKTNTEQKAFDSTKLGYSIFATSLADMRRILAKPEFSEFGSVGIECINGGLYQTC
jgi:hypothetical protein